MGKTIAIGDTHGRKNWKKIVEQECDKIIFIGDYFDSFNVPGQDQIENFKDIVAFKRANMDKVILLIGNHDFHYMEAAGEQYSGFQRGFQYMIQSLIKENMDILQMCHSEGEFLFTHAGVTQTWADANDILTGQVDNPIDFQINELFKHKPASFRFTHGSKYNNYGDEICQTPIWVRPRSLQQDLPFGYTQVVGHTQQESLNITEGVILIDVLDTVDEWLVIEDGKASVGKEVE